MAKRGGTPCTVKALLLAVLLAGLLVGAEAGLLSTIRSFFRPSGASSGAPSNDAPVQGNNTSNSIQGDASKAKVRVKVHAASTPNAHKAKPKPHSLSKPPSKPRGKPRPPAPPAKSTPTFNQLGVLKTNWSCPPPDPPEDPRSQRILITLEAFCQSTYDKETEAYCQHHERAFNSRCRSADLAIENRLTRSSTPRGEYKGAYTAWMRRVAPHMQEMGWGQYQWSSFNSTKFWQKAAKADILIISILNFRHVVRVYPNKRYILVQTNDAATLSMALGCDPDDPRVLGILQHTALRPMSENNLRVLDNRRHFEWMEPHHKDSEYMWRRPPLSRKAMKKVHVAIPQIYRWRYPLDCGGYRPFSRILPAFKEDPGEWLGKSFYDRHYDVAFVGTINHQEEREKGGVNRHRRAALNAIKAMKEKHPYLNILVPHLASKTAGHLPYDQFLKLLKNTKFFVSPFGLGEFSGKDYESLLSGAILVKPWAHKLQSYPNIYNGSFVIDTDIDFSDLEAKLMPYLRDCRRGSKEKDKKACRKRHQDMEERSTRNLAVLKSSVEERSLAADWDQLLFSMASRKIEHRCGRCAPPRQDEWMYTEQGQLKPEKTLAKEQEAASAKGHGAHQR